MATILSMLLQCYKAVRESGSETTFADKRSLKQVRIYIVEVLITQILAVVSVIYKLILQIEQIFPLLKYVR